MPSDKTYTGSGPSHLAAFLIPYTPPLYALSALYPHLSPPGGHLTRRVRNKQRGVNLEWSNVMRTNLASFIKDDGGGRIKRPG